MEPAPSRQPPETQVSEAQEQQKVAGFCQSRDEGEVRPREKICLGRRAEVREHRRNRDGCERSEEAPGEV